MATQGPRLVVSVGADISNLVAGLTRAQQVTSSAANGMTNATNQATRSFTILNQTPFTFGANFQRAANSVTTSSRQTTAALNQTTAAATRTGAAVTSAALRMSTSQATYQNWGRVIQDLPFGLMGIQNNLTQLIPSIGLLGLGFSALIAGLTFLQVGTSAWTRGLTNNKKAVDESTQSNEDYLKSLEDVREASVKGAQDSAKELATLKALYSAYSNASLPLEKRKETYKQIQELYPAYFGNLSFEEKASKNVSVAYDKLTNSIIATGRARAAIDIITKNATDQLTNEEKIADFRGKLSKAEDELEKVREKNRQELVRTGLYNSEALRSAQSKREQDALKVVLEYRKNIYNLEAVNYNLQNASLRLQEKITEEVKKGAVISGSVGGALTKKDREDLKLLETTTVADKLGLIAKAKKEIFDLQGDIFRTDDAEKVAAIEDAIAGLNAQIKALESTTSQQQSTLGLEGLTANLPKAQKEIKKFVPEVTQFAKDTASLISNGITSGFSGIGDAIGSALANGDNVLEAFGASILGTIGDILMQFGKLTIAAGVASLALKSALKLGNPIAAIAAGTALVAVGAAVKGFSANIGKDDNQNSPGSTQRRIPGFAHGVTDFAGGIAKVHKNEALVNLSPGTDVIPATRAAGLFGGNETQIFIADTRISGEDIVISYNRTQRKNSRQG